jgi:MGT family glycosyltransferase
MAKYAFLNFPTYGQMNPTLAMVRELKARGEEVIYFTSETFRHAVEAAGAKLLSYDAALFRQEESRRESAQDANRRLALLPIRMLRASRHMVPPLLDRVRTERPDCLVYSDMFLWARIIAHALDIPGVALRPTYAPNARFRKVTFEGTAIRSSPSTPPDWINVELAHLRAAYALPFCDAASLIRGDEGLTIVFLPRAFQPDGDAFDDRFLFVGPSIHPQRDQGQCISFEGIHDRPLLFISLGTVFNNAPQFYQTCFSAFGGTEWHVVLSMGNPIDPAVCQSVPANFTAAAYVPQLEILSHADIFISHGGMNSTMESLYFGVPIIAMPHINEQKLTARRVEDLGLGVALNEADVTAPVLRQAVSRIRGDSGFVQRVRRMQEHIRSAGGFHRAVDALQDHLRNHRQRASP